MRATRLGRAAEAAALLVLTACARLPTGLRPCPTDAAPLFAVQAASSPYDSLFAAAGAEFRVPAELLKALGWVETRLQMVRGAEEFPGRPPAFGVMALRSPALERGAALAGVTVEAARGDARANIRAAAALIQAYATETAIDRLRPDAWEPVVLRFAGITLPAGRAAYLRDVVRAHGLGAAAARLVALEPCPPEPAGARDYAAAVWRPSPNFNQRPGATGSTHVVIVHTCESNYASCWSWLVNSASQVSAHYVVNEEGSEMSQLVLERDRAWHIAALYDCDLNRGHHCSLNDAQSNDFTVGIEHAGFASQTAFPASQIEASAALLCDITRDRGIPRDWQHVVAHGQLQPENRTDPGPNWPWIAYLHRAQALCGETVVDDSARYNDATVASANVPSGWGATNSAPDYYGGGYRWASTAPDATDGAVFSFRVAAAGARTLDARWTSGPNRSPRAAFSVVTEAGNTLGTVRVDQRSGGGVWHTLGTWTFPAGWHRVVVSRRDSTGTVVVADAVRVR